VGTTADMIMRDASTGFYEIYDLGNNAILGAGFLGQVGAEWQVAGVGAFNAPDTSDMILRNSNTGQFEIYDISNNNLTGAAPMGQVGLEWTVSGFGDFSSRTGETDMLMRKQQWPVRDLRSRQQRHYLGRPDGAGRPGMVGRWLRRLLDAGQRERHADAQQQYRHIRAIRHQQ